MNYRERLHPSPWAAVALLLLPPAIMVVCAPINPLIGFILGPALYIVIVLIAYATSPMIVVDGVNVKAGRAKIPVRLVADPVSLAPRDRALALSTELDARAYLCTRGTRIGMVKILINDPDDPTPYWLVSSRHPDAFVASLQDAIARAPRTRD